MQSREQTESNRQAIIRAIMEDTGMPYDQAAAEESRRFCRALAEFNRSGRVVRHQHRGRTEESAS